MDTIITSEALLKAALAAAKPGDRLIIDGRMQLSDTVVLEGAEGLTLQGINGAMFDYTNDVTGFKAEEINGVTVWAAEIPAATAAHRPYAAYKADGRMLHRPRLPKTGFYRVKAATDGDMFKTPMFDGNIGIVYGEGEIPALKYPEVAEVRCFHWWTDEQLRVAAHDPEARTITFDRKSILAVRSENSLTDGTRWYLDNVFEALDAPGEYFITPECDKVYYVPEEGDTLEGFKLALSTSTFIMKLTGCKNITFRDITFKGSDRDKLDLVRNFSQAAVEVPCAVQLDGCEAVTFDSCALIDVGLSGIGIDKGSHDITIDHCRMIGIGGNAVHIAGRNLKAEEWHSTVGANSVPKCPEDIIHGIKVTNCHIGDYGRVYFNACGILLRYAYDCDLSCNEIHDGYYTGISVGWTWGYAAHATHHIRMEYNHIWNIGKTLLSDMGGIYTLGHQEGSVIRGNRIHNIEMDSYGGWGVYLDEGSSDILVEGNIAYDVTAQPFHQHYGANNLLRNNIFAFGEGGAFIVSRKEEHLGVILERNILVSDGTPIYAKTPEGLHITDCMNLVWNYSGEPISGPMNFDVYKREYSFPEENKRTPAQMQEGGLFAGVIIADPMFVDAKNRDFRLRAGSPAAALGFKVEE